MSAEGVIEKIYANDSKIRYKSTKKTAMDSRRDIDAELSRWGIKKVMWTWDIEGNEVELVFQFSELFKDQRVSPVVRLKPPVIWKKPVRGKPEEIDWRVSMRIFHWYIQNQFQMIYAMQSSRTLAFLPHIVVSDEETVGDVIVPHLDDIKRLAKALPEKKVDASKVIDVPPQ